MVRKFLHFRQSLAYSHAKLSLRSEVTMDDALMAIRLYEESLTARFGKCIYILFFVNVIF